MSRHGTAARYIHEGCRCDECRAENTERCRRIVERLRQRPSEDVPHGTRGGYGNWGCRCDQCTAANTEACRQYWARRRDWILQRRKAARR